MRKNTRGIVARVAVTLLVMAGSLLAACHIDKESTQERERREVLELVNQECTDRLSKREGDDAVYACDMAADKAMKVYGPEYTMKWHEREDYWTFVPVGQ